MNLTVNREFIALMLVILIMVGCNKKNNLSESEESCKIIFLHHSTGNVIYKGGSTSSKIKNYDVPVWINKYNETNGTLYMITEQSFPQKSPYGWNNYPYDYYNIWVKNAGDSHYKEEPTLEILAEKYDMIILKHCYPVSHVIEDTGNPNINSDEKSIETYKLQYNALKQKMLQFPDTKFLVWTGAALLKSRTNEAEALRAQEFFSWVKNTWNVNDDNIYIWDFHELETEGGLYLKVENARSETDPHPGVGFAARVAPLFCQRIVDVIENNGALTTLTGHKK